MFSREYLKPTINLHWSKCGEKDTKYTDKKIKAQQSTSDRINTAASMFNFPTRAYFRLRIPFPVGLLLHVTDLCRSYIALLPHSGHSSSLLS